MSTWAGRMGWIVGGALLVWLAGARHDLYSQIGAAAPRFENGRLQMVSTAVAAGTQLVVLDDSIRSLAVYHVDAAGNLQLRSVRSLNWDFRMEEFNGAAPLPSELRRLQP